MPEMLFDVRWPDGEAMRCYSPSLVIKEYFVAGASYPVADFLNRARTAYQIADDRVRARWGWGCAHGQRQLQDIEARACAFAPDALVQVEAFESTLP
jgi:uncharacterized repeat protein (TIGR04042 family)